MSKLYRFGAGSMVACMLGAICGAATSLWAQDITGFQNGYLTFTNDNPAMYYRVEFRPNLAGPEAWRHDLPIDIQTNAPTVTVPVGVFYRVVGSTTPIGDGNASYSAAVPQTGQTNSLYIGDDGDLRKGVPWPNPRFADNGNGTVTDNITGLIWLRNAYAFGAPNWAGALSACATLNSGEAGLTDGSAEGDWRLPNIREMQSLLDFGRSNPALPPEHPFRNVQFAPYWSSTVSYDNVFVWSVNIASGELRRDSQTNTDPVWPVRGGQ